MDANLNSKLGTGYLGIDAFPVLPSVPQLFRPSMDYRRVAPASKKELWESMPLI